MSTPQEQARYRAAAIASAELQGWVQTEAGLWDDHDEHIATIDQAQAVIDSAAPGMLIPLEHQGSGMWIVLLHPQAWDTLCEAGWLGFEADDERGSQIALEVEMD